MQMSLYRSHSFLSLTANGTLPKRRQYRVTPRAQMSIAFVIGSLRVIATDKSPGESKDDRVLDAELTGDGSALESNTTSSVRKDGVPAVLERSDSSSRMGLCGSSVS
jgi:hypothetical protein